MLIGIIFKRDFAKIKVVFIRKFMMEPFNAYQFERRM